MKLNKIYEETFNSSGSYLCAEMASADSFVVLTSDGKIYKRDLLNNSCKHLFSVRNESISYPNGGFDLNAECSIYTIDSIVVLVNDYKLNGVIYNPAISQNIWLYRKDYHADISQYSIALYKNELGVPHLIYAVDWNHIQIMNLETLQVLTADKSLIVENAEQKYLDFYKSWSGPRNYLPWPSNFDYFFGQLLLSPDRTKFLSRGWSWGSYDDFKVFEIAPFIGSNRISEQSVFGGEHLNRPVCWLDDETIVTTYYPYRDDSATAISTNILVLKLGQSEPVTQFVFHESAEVTGDLYFYPQKNILVSTSHEFGTTVFNTGGSIVFKDENFKPASFYPAYGLFLEIKYNVISIYKLE